MDYKVKLNIADIVFLVCCRIKEPVFWLKENYQPFFSEQKTDFRVYIKIDKNNKAFSRNFVGIRAEWKARRFLAQTKFFRLDLDFVKRVAFVSAREDFGIVDLMRFLCYVILIKNGGLLLHAAAVLNNDGCYIFSGPTESGKTTIARVSADKIVLNDEAIAIIRNNGSYKAYSTPFSGEFGKIECNTGAPIKTIFHINKDKHFRHSLLKPPDALKELLRNMLISIPDLKFTNSLFDSLEGLVKNIPCYQLYFKPERTIWSYINGFIK